MVETGVRAAGKSLYEVGLPRFNQESLAIHGMISLERGFIFTSMILAAIGVALIERRFERAGLWSLAASALSAIGVIHAYDLTPAGVVNRFGFLAAPEFAAGYLMLAALFFAVASLAKRSRV
jgi:AGZA family xanthine/uracil permease-like MFS transporter